MRAALLFLCLAPAASQAQVPKAFGPDRTLLSETLVSALRDIKGQLEATPYGRRLYAATLETPVVERDGLPGAVVQYRGGEKPAILVDGARAKEPTLWEFEALFVAARFKAAAGVDLPLVELEAAAQQAVLRYALEKAQVHPEFAKALSQAALAAEKEAGSRMALREWAAAVPGSGEAVLGGRLFPGKRPTETLARLAFDLFVFSEDPYAFYLAVEQSSGLPEEAVRLTELEDFMEAFAGRLKTIRYHAGGRYAVIDGRPYAGTLARAAARVGTRDALARLREGLGPFRTVGVEELRPEVNRFLREAKKKKK